MRILLKIFGVYIGIFSFLACTLLFNRLRERWRLLVIPFVAVSLFIPYSIARHNLVPYGADKNSRDRLFTGDEPAYLFTALSIAKDGDLNLFNNIRDKAWLAFQKRPILGRGYAFYNMISKGRISSKRDRWKNKRYMAHRPGISLCLAPVFLFAQSNYRWWSYFLISMVLTGFGVIAFLYAIRSNVPSGDAAIGVLVCLLSPPVIFYANQVYPEVICGVLLAVSLLILKLEPRYFIWATLLLSFSIWFSDRALIAIFLFYILLLIKLKTKKQRIISLVIFGLSALAFMLYCYNRFGVPWPVVNNPIGFDFKVLPRRFIQILFDAKQGWFWQFPVLLIVPIMFLDLYRKYDDRLFILFASIGVISILVLVASFNDWRGGTNPRDRYYVIPQIIFLVFLIEWFATGVSKEKKKLVCFLMLGSVSLTMIPWLIQHPNWWFRQYHPFFGLKSLQPFYKYLPSLGDNAPQIEWVKLILWISLFTLIMGILIFRLYFPRAPQKSDET